VARAELQPAASGTYVEAGRHHRQARDDARAGLSDGITGTVAASQPLDRDGRHDGSWHEEAARTHMRRGDDGRARVHHHYRLDDRVICC